MYWLISLLVIFITVILYFCIKFALIIINIKDAIEESLDEIDNSYSKISEILSIPIFHDSREVKIVLGEIKNSRDTLLYIAGKLSDSIDERKDEIDEQQ